MRRIILLSDTRAHLGTEALSAKRLIQTMDSDVKTVHFTPGGIFSLSGIVPIKHVNIHSLLSSSDGIIILKESYFTEGESARTKEFYTSLADYAEKMKIKVYNLLPEQLLADRGSYKTKERYFALILSKSSRMSKSDIIAISEKTGLSPVFIYSGYEDNLDVSRHFSRTLGAKIVKPHRYEDIRRLLRRTSFMISESRRGAYFSVLCHTPVYVDASIEDLRELVTEAICAGDRGSSIIPYTKNRMSKIEKVEAESSDFSGIINHVRGLSQKALSEFISG